MAQAHFFPLTSKNIKLMIKKRKTALIDKGYQLEGVGALFLGKKNNRKVVYLVMDYMGELSSFGGHLEKRHRDAIENLTEEVLEESATTLDITSINGKLILNNSLNLMVQGIIMDTFGTRKNKVYRIFVFNLGNKYNSFCSSQEYTNSRNLLLQKENISKSFLETTSSHHVFISDLKKIKCNREIKDISGKQFILRPRTYRIFKLLFDKKLKFI